MAIPLQIASKAEFDNLLASSTIVVADFYADWCGPCKAIAPVFAQLSVKLSRPKKITFAKVNTDNVTEVAQMYSVRALPTFIIFKNRQVVDTIKGADAPALQAAIKKLSAEAMDNGEGGYGSVGGDAPWLAKQPAKGYRDVTDEIDLRGLDLLNASSNAGVAKTLFEGRRPTRLDQAQGKGKSVSTGADSKNNDWVESDTDEQLMLFIPFQATLKIQALQITSIPPKDDSDIMRPKTINLFINRSTNLDFDEAEDLEATQSITLKTSDWDVSGNINIDLRFVKFQKVSSLIVFVVDGDGEGDKVQLDRLRIIGESGERRDPGKLGKVEDE